MLGKDSVTLFYKQQNQSKRFVESTFVYQLGSSVRLKNKFSRFDSHRQTLCCVTAYSIELASTIPFLCFYVHHHNDIALKFHY